MEEGCKFAEILASGINTIFNYNNIAVSVLMACLIFAGLWISRLLQSIVIVKDALNDVKITIAILNERLTHKNDTDN